MSDLLKVKIGGRSFLCKFTYPTPLPEGYRRVKYIEMTGTGYPVTTDRFYLDKILKDMTSIDTVDMELYVPPTAGLTGSNNFGVYRLANNSGYADVWNDSVALKFQAYRELSANSLDNLGKTVTIRRSARAVQPGDAVPYGYSYVGQLTVNGNLIELGRYDNLQSIDVYSQTGEFFIPSGNNYGDIAGIQIHKIRITEYQSDNVKYDFIPCIRVSDSRPGFYEPNHEYFLISRDNGVWAAGPNA